MAVERQTEKKKDRVSHRGAPLLKRIRKKSTTLVKIQITKKEEEKIQSSSIFLTMLFFPLQPVPLKNFKKKIFL